MNAKDSRSEYLVISRGQWDKDRSPEEIQGAIDRFYAWYDRLVQEGKINPGRRLEREGRLVSKGKVTDGPFSEAKEVIGGYWFIVAASLDEAAQLAAENPCLAVGLSYEVRPFATARNSAFVKSSETPGT